MQLKCRILAAGKRAGGIGDRLLVYWCISLLVCWFVGLLVYWFISLLVYWFIGCLVLVQSVAVCPFFCFTVLLSAPTHNYSKASCWRAH